jgi:pyruvate/oxaloacetate carboxyltransferase
MTKTVNRLAIYMALLCCAFMIETAHAEHALAAESAPVQFIVQLPAVDHETLIEQLEILRSQLLQRKQALVLLVADEKLDSRDALITVLLPGGLLYAGYKKVRYEQARSELAQVNADIDEFSNDLLAMQSSATPVVVAQLP